MNSLSRINCWSIWSYVRIEQSNFADHSWSYQIIKQSILLISRLILQNERASLSRLKCWFKIDLMKSLSRINCWSIWSYVRIKQSKLLIKIDLMNSLSRVNCWFKVDLTKWTRRVKLLIKVDLMDHWSQSNADSKWILWDHWAE